MIVTGVERQRRRRRVNLFVDGRFALALGVELAAERDVCVGRAITPDELSALAEEEGRRGGLQSALRLLSHRSRSEQELRERLAQKGFERGIVEATLTRLRELGLVDDSAFARAWTETRQALRPRSRRLLTTELRRRGVAAETAEQATEGVLDEEAAYEAARGRLRALAGLEYQAFRERLGSFLIRRGFSYDIARGTIERCWREPGESQAG